MSVFLVWCEMMNYPELMECKRPSCQGIQVIPIKIVVKENRVAVVSRCPNCRKKHKVILNMQERNEWLPLIRKLFLLCEVCGQPLSPNWRIYGSGPAFNPNMHWGRNIRLANPCYNCQKNDLKSISEFLWSEIKPLPPPPPPNTVSPPSKSGQAVPSEPIFCTQCGSALTPGSKFCAACGARV